MFTTRLLAAAVTACAAFGLGAAASAVPTWLAPTGLTTSGRVAAASLAVAATGEAVAVWDREVGSVCADQPANPACVHVVEARSRAAGAHEWAPPVEIARPGVGAAPQVAVDPRGDAVAVWSHDIGVDRVLQASVRTGPTGTWQEPVDLSEPATSIGAHPVALDGTGDAIAAWADATTVRAESRLAASGVWGSPVPLSRSGRAAPVGPSLGVDAAGDAVVAWSLSGVV
ncbi:MAG: hypothetical protein E6G22_00790 [Actinobacteria bacterium]|nr:MAG: hypothetical protein E6G22_00790 [Actinomycetota bacterium]